MTDIPEASHPVGHKLRQFCEVFPGGATAFAKQIGATRQTVYNYIVGKRFPTLEKAYLIEQVSKGKILTTEWAQASLARKSPERKQSEPKTLDSIL